MKVFIVQWKFWNEEEDRSEIRGVFTTQEKAELYVKDHAHEEIDNDKNGVFFEIEEHEVE